jgi:metal-dependent amidase/aminoacylase/carboxypeptidase family protein
VICDAYIVDRLKNAANTAGVDYRKYEKSMGGEDFAFYLKYAPGAFVWQGVRRGESHPPLHNSNYTVPEGATLPAVKILMEYILSHQE